MLRNLPAFVRSGPSWLRAVVVVLAMAAGFKLGTEFYRLVFDPGPLGAVDLKLRFEDVQWWFSGAPLYDYVHTAVYPPASYVMLWPLLGWTTWSQARLLWALVMAISLMAFSWLLVRRTGARRPSERLFAALMLLSMNAAGVCVGNGQLSLFVVFLAAAAVLLLDRDRYWARTGPVPAGPDRTTTWMVDSVAALAMLVSLVKPTLAAPFFWLVLFVPGRWRPGILVVVGYVLLTLLGAVFQKPGVVPLLGNWLQQAGADCLPYGSADLHILLYVLGLGDWVFPASLLVLGALGLWVWLHRRVDILVLLGVTALVARFWTYHGTYDDLVVVLPMVVLFRDARARLLARFLLASAVIVMLLPVTLHHFAPPPWPSVFALAHGAAWLTMLGYLLVRAHRDLRALRTGTGR